MDLRDQDDGRYTDSQNFSKLLDVNQEIIWTSTYTAYLKDASR